MGHGHGDHAPYTIPDYRIYKVEDVPQLMATKKALAAQGLCDPWLRNEVWRYNKKHFGTEGSRAYNMIFRGFKYGFAAFVVTVIATSVMGKSGGHGDHGHDHH